MVCAGCGAGARDDARFCLNCGQPLEPGSDASPPVPPARRVPEAPTEAIAPSVELAEPDLIRCARCDAPNSTNRRRCGRCGADLVTGEPSGRPPVPRPQTPTAPEGPDTGPLGVQRRRSPRPLVAVVGLGIVLGGAIGGLAVAEVGPFAEATVQPVPVFDPGVYVGSPRPLAVEQVLASSTHEPQGENRYDARLVADNDLDTAWNSDGGVRANGVGESLRLELTQPSWVSAIVIANGYQKDDRAFVANARVQRLRLALGDGHVYDVTVLDRTGRQVVTLAAPVLTSHVTLSVLEAYPGETYDDLAISELELRGWSAVGQDLDRFSPGPPGGADAGSGPGA